MNTNIENQLREQGFHVSTTVGHSMRPMLRDRCDRVIIKPLGTERLKKYDFNTITYYSDRFSKWLESNPYGGR